MNSASRFPLLALVALAFGATALAAESSTSAPDTKPRVISAKAPVRPTPMFSFGKTGVVEVDFTITTQGEVTDARVHVSTDSLLDQAALDAIKQWKFSPALRSGTAVAVSARQSFYFEPPHQQKDLPATTPAPKTMVAKTK